MEERGGCDDVAGEGRGSLLVLVSHNSAAGSLITRNKLGRRKDGDWLLGERGDKSKKVLFSSLLNFKGFPLSLSHTHILSRSVHEEVIGMMGEPAFSLSPVPLQKSLPETVLLAPPFLQIPAKVYNPVA